MEYKTKNMNLQLFAPVHGPFYNIFYLDGHQQNVVLSSQTGATSSITSLYITYHNSNIYGIVVEAGGAIPSYSEIISSGNLILSDVNAEYTGSFFENPSNWDSNTEEGYLVENEVIRAGYFADFTTYHTTKVPQGYSSTINLTNCRCTKSAETELSGSYSATVTADNGYYLSSVTTTLGTATIATNKKTAEITISDVTNNFTIEAMGTTITQKDVILHPDNNGVIDYTAEILPKVKSATTLEINRLFRTRYTITPTITYGTSSGDEYIWSGETASVTITPDPDHDLPSSSSVIITNATGDFTNWNDGVIELSNATGNVTISATCVSAGYSGNITTYNYMGSGPSFYPCETAIKFDTEPTSSNDYDAYVNASGTFTGITSYINRSKIYAWSPSYIGSAITINDNESYSGSSTYDYPQEITLTGNYDISLGYKAGGQPQL